MTENNIKPLLPTLVAGARGIVPQSFDDCYRIGQLLAKSGMVPKDYAGNPEACTVAIMQGLEVGMSPMAAIQSIAVINGRPNLWGDGMLGVVEASGQLEWKREEDDGVTATCTVKRKGKSETSRKFSMDDAKKAGLTGKTGPWTTYPARMRQMRARAWALRDEFSDVLKGFGSAEEATDIPVMRDITPKLALAVPDIPPIPSAPEPPPLATAGEAKAQFLEALETALSLAKTPDDLGEVWVSNEDQAKALGVEDEANQLFEIAEKKLTD